MKQLDDWIKIKAKMDGVGDIIIKSERQKRLGEIGSMLKDYMQTYHEKFNYSAKPQEIKQCKEQ